MEVNYYEFAGFEQIYLEDSYILDLKITPLILLIYMEIVLTENHFLYRKPLPNEHYCCRKAQITFSNVESVVWTEKIKGSYRDATGEIDFGNIDTFVLTNGIYKITGDLGNLEIISEMPKLEFD